MDKRIHDDRTKRHISYTQQQNTPRIDYEEWKKYVLHLIKSGKPVDEALSITDSVSENITDESGKVTHIVSQFDYNDILDRLEKDLTIDTNMKKELIYGLTHSDLIVSRLAAGEKQKPVIVDRSVYEGIMDRRAQRRNRDERTLRRLPG